MIQATRTILDHFEMVSRIPRPSRGEAQLRSRLSQWAAEAGLRSRCDGPGNLLIEVPPSPGFEHAPTVVLQGHMDMVGEKLPDSQHNFDSDPIQTVTDGEWLTAAGTTLGADNGIAIAIALALAGNRSVRHPALELLFTVDEESGMSGASGLDAGLLRGRVLINLDSEDEGVITVGCAGGANLVLSLPAAQTAVATGRAASRLRGLSLGVGGVSGGHSGIDIHRGRANANSLLARLLLHYVDAESFRLVSIRGGSAHNAIARDARADFMIAAEELAAREESFDRLVVDLQREYRHSDPGLTVECTPLAEPPAFWRSRRAGIRTVQLLNALPHGVATWSHDMAGRVQTSSNLAVVTTRQDAIEVLASLRGSVESELRALSARHRTIAELAQADVRSQSSYAGWQPKMDSELLGRARDVYRGLFGADAKVEVVHAGLECGVIGARYPDMQMISIGPTIIDAHSPAERLHIPSLARTWKFLAALLASYCSDSGSS